MRPKIIVAYNYLNKYNSVKIYKVSNYILENN